MTCSHHHPAPKNFNAAFLIGIVLNTVFILTETGAGLWGHSLALLADAAHNLGDVLGLVVAWLGYHFAQKAPSARYTAGFGRLSIYTTIANGVFLIVSSAWIIIESVRRFQAPQTPAVGLVIGVALLGIVINLGTAWALLRGQHDINIKGAFLHMLGDAGISAAVAVSALIIGLTGWLVIDPLLGLGVAALVLWSSWPLLREGLHLAMDGVPSAIKIDEMTAFIQDQPAIESVHDLRVWALSTTKTALAAHIKLIPDTDSQSALAALDHDLRHRFGLSHVTLQLEAPGFSCMP